MVKVPHFTNVSQGGHIHSPDRTGERTHNIYFKISVNSLGSIVFGAHVGGRWLHWIVWGVDPPNPGEKLIHLRGGLSSTNLTHPQSGAKGLLSGVRGPFLPVAAMVVLLLLAVGGWGTSLLLCTWFQRRGSRVGVVHIFYRINLFFGLNFSFGLKVRRHGRSCRLNFRRFRS